MEESGGFEPQTREGPIRLAGDGGTLATSLSTIVAAMGLEPMTSHLWGDRCSSLAAVADRGLAPRERPERMRLSASVCTIRYDFLGAPGRYRSVVRSLPRTYSTFELQGRIHNLLLSEYGDHRGPWNRLDLEPYGLYSKLNRM